jgi:hypothetical protein
MGISMNIYGHQLRKDVFGAALFGKSAGSMPKCWEGHRLHREHCRRRGREFCHKKTVDLTIYTMSIKSRRFYEITSPPKTCYIFQVGELKTLKPNT